MLVSDVMTTNVVSIPSSTPVAEARRLMDAHHFRRLPVIDRGKLVGVVTRDALDRMGPSQLTTFSVHELSYLLNKITVKETMHRDVVTVTPNMTAEEAVAVAQTKHVGMLIVADEGKVVGVATTNDFFYKILNPILGIGLPGSRICVLSCCEGPDIEKIVAAVNKLGITITNLFIIDLPDVKRRDLVIHLNTEDSSRAVQEIERLGCTVEKRAR